MKYSKNLYSLGEATQYFFFSMGITVPAKRLIDMNLIQVATRSKSSQPCSIQGRNVN